MVLSLPGVDHQPLAGVLGGKPAHVDAVMRRYQAVLFVCIADGGEVAADNIEACRCPSQPPTQLLLSPQAALKPGNEETGGELGTAPVFLAWSRAMGNMRRCSSVTGEKEPQATMMSGTLPGAQVRLSRWTGKA